MHRRKPPRVKREPRDFFATGVIRTPIDGGASVPASRVSLCGRVRQPEE